jgi:hypothetical protein
MILSFFDGMSICQSPVASTLELMLEDHLIQKNVSSIYPFDDHTGYVDDIFHGYVVWQ